MPWARLDDDFHDNGKILSLSHAAFRLYVCAITYCRRHRTEGALAAAQVEALCRQQRIARTAPAELVAKRAWHEDGPGYRIHDFADYQPRTDETNAERQQRFRNRRKTGSNGVTAAVTPDTSNGVVTPLRNDPVPIPNPVPHEASALEEDLRTNETARAGGTADAVRAFAVPKPGLAPGSPHAALLSAFADATGYAQPTTASARKKWTEPVAELVHAGVTGDEVRDLVAAFEDQNSVPVTLQGIANQLPQLRKPRPHRPRNGHGAPSKLGQTAANWRELEEESHDLEPSSAHRDALAGSLPDAGRREADARAVP